jgi:hypothetical protein
MNRITTRPGKFETLDPTAVMTIKIKKDDMYATLRPTIGISDIGLKMSGPMPYPSTYMDRTRDDTSAESPHISMKMPSAGVMIAEAL